MTYANRDQAGEVLAGELAGYTGRADAIVLGLPRGGVPVAARVAELLVLRLDVLVVRKLGVPWAPEVAFGALGSGGVVVHNDQVEEYVPAREVERVISGERGEVYRREALYRRGRPPLSLHGQVAIIVDDGLATGATARAAVGVARQLGAVRVVVAAPVGSVEAVEALRGVADEVVCPLVPPRFGAVGAYFDSFPQTSDAQVLALLDRLS